LFHTATGDPAPGFRPFVCKRGAGSLLEFSPNGRHLLAADQDGTELFLLDAETGRLVQTIRPAGRITGPVVFDPRNYMLALTHRGRDGQDVIGIYEVSSGQKRLELSP